MTDTTAASELPPPPAPPKPSHRGRTITILVVVGVLVLVGGLYIWSSLTPTPEFPSLADDPDPSLHGTVAFWKPGHDEDDCIQLVAASGGTPEELTCVGDASGGELLWLPDGRLQVTGYGSAQDPIKVRKIVDVATGEVEDVPIDEIPDHGEDWSWPPDVPGPNGEVVTSDSSGGTLRVTLTTEGDTRTLLSVDAPETYTFGNPSWSSDGSWFVVKDDLDRLLTITTADPSQTRVLVDGHGQAVTDAEWLEIR